MSTPHRDPLISIAMCTYNGERFVAAQLASLLAQTWPQLEIVVVDDHSNDATVSIIESFAQRDNRIKLHRNPQNMGINRNFSLAMSLCQGEFIAPCDQDDVWHPEKLALLHAIMPGHVLTYCDSELIAEDGAGMNMRISDRIHMYQGNDPTVFAFWNCVSGHAMLFRRTLLAVALPIPDIKFHDWWLAFLATANGSIAYLNQPLVQYRQHANAQTDLSRTVGKTDKGNRTCLFKERGQWLGYLARTPSAQQAFFTTLHRLWQAQNGQWISIKLIQHMATRSQALLFINKNRSFFRFALKNFWGLKSKSFFNPSNYSKF